MRGHFSIEWMAKSSLSAEPGSPSVSTTTTTPGCSTSGTHSETLPGFYYRPRPGTEASSGPAATHGFPSNPSFPTKEAGVSNQEIPRKSNNQQGKFNYEPLTLNELITKLLQAIFTLGKTKLNSLPASGGSQMNE